MASYGSRHVILIKHLTQYNYMYIVKAALMLCVKLAELVVFFNALLFSLCII